MKIEAPEPRPLLAGKIESWIHTIVHGFILVAIVSLVIFTIALFGYTNQRISEVDTELDNLYQVIEIK